MELCCLLNWLSFMFGFFLSVYIFDSIFYLKELYLFSGVQNIRGYIYKVFCLINSYYLLIEPIKMSNINLAQTLLQ